MSNDAQIKNLLEVVEKKKKELGDKPTRTSITNGLFKYDDRNTVNINTVNDATVFVEILSFILDRKKTTEEASKRLGVEAKKFEWAGFTLEQWEEDFKSRVELIKWNQKKKDLDATNKKLKELISEDGKTAMALEEIAKSLSV